MCSREPGDTAGRTSLGQDARRRLAYIGIVRLEEVINERSVIDASFRKRACDAAFRTLSSSTPELMRRGIQALAVVAGAPEQAITKAFASAPQTEIAADARACMFYLKKRQVSNRDACLRV
jgi:hypothetical protein